MLRPDGAKSHHMKRAFHREQVNGKSVVKGGSEEKRGQVHDLSHGSETHVAVYISWHVLFGCEAFQA